MKKTMIMLTSRAFSLVSLASNATFINVTTDQASYQAGDTVFVDLVVDNISVETAELGFELNFDSSLIAFDSFTFSDDVLFSAFIAGADLSWTADNIVEFFVIWWDSADLPAASFTALQVPLPTSSLLMLLALFILPLHKKRSFK